MIEGSSFQPQWCSPPGDTISDLLRKKQITLAEFARLMHASSDWVYELTNGVAEIDQTVAVRLQVVLGLTSAFWVTRRKINLRARVVAPPQLKQQVGCCSY